MELSEADQQELFIKCSFRIYGDKTGWTESGSGLSHFDERMLLYIDRIIERHVKRADRSPVVLDLGCGTGRCLHWLQQRHQNWTFIGVDPVDTATLGRSVLVGTANKIPLGDDSVDCIYAYIALQHVANIENALREGWRVLRKGGIFVIFDRNPLSIRGLLKFWHQANGRWIYAWDAPFREHWYSARKWRSLFRKTGYRIQAARTFTARGGGGFRMLLPINRFVLLAASKASSGLS
jgi:SAM-dependent methyltransferase